MGTLAMASCPCGYENDGLFIGGTMTSFMDQCAAPALCENCNEVVTIDLMDPDGARCPACGGQTDRYDDPKLRGEAWRGDQSPMGDLDWRLPDGRSFRLQEGIPYHCPLCREVTMTFVRRGFAC